MKISKQELRNSKKLH
ncbi:hypothetical protein Pint_19019 [Pistacia integerrima]|uniref:Uncharacterized protein n=1 Tax=Pistacia integerrima TaxID=434235 RepID=A0ACC0YW96_9ROSI|nr:hypothetical protein Pint_19019 [Pistacia integerrima]